MYRFLMSDSTFRALNIPISPDERKEMERKIRKNEPVEPITSWRGYILTGYEQDDLSLKYHRNIPSTEVFFPRKSDAVAWLCHQQLKRTDLIWTAKAWLISRLYEALRDISKRQSARDTFQYRQFSPSFDSSEYITTPRESGIIMKQIGDELNYHKETVRRYVQFGRQLDRLEETVPGIRNRVLTGDLSVMMCHMHILVKLPAQELEKLANDHHSHRLLPPAEYINETAGRKTYRQRTNIRVETGIKQMPEYDPDADLNGLKYTIGAWIKAISRTTAQANFSRATIAGKENLKQVLRKLIQEAEHLCNMLEENQND